MLPRSASRLAARGAPPRRAPERAGGGHRLRPFRPVVHYYVLYPYYLRVVRPRTRASDRQLRDVSGAPMAVSVAILYAGRWFGRAGQQLDNNEDTPITTRPTRCALPGGGVSRPVVRPPPQAPMRRPASQPRWPRCSVQAGRRTPRLLARELERLLRAAQRAAVDAGGKAAARRR